MAPIWLSSIIQTSTWGTCFMQEPTENLMKFHEIKFRFRWYSKPAKRPRIRSKAELLGTCWQQCLGPWLDKWLKRLPQPLTWSPDGGLFMELMSTSGDQESVQSSLSLDYTPERMPTAEGCRRTRLHWLTVQSWCVYTDGLLQNYIQVSRLPAVSPVAVQTVHTSMKFGAGHELGDDKI